MATHQVEWQATPPENCRRGAVAIGNFDGVHRGHAALVAELRRHADAAGGPAVALTFDPHPLQLLRPRPPPSPTAAAGCTTSAPTTSSSCTPPPTCWPCPPRPSSPRSSGSAWPP